MGKYEVTQKEWAAVMGPIELDRSASVQFSRRPRIRYGDVNEKNPVLGVSWDDAQEFIEKLNALDSRRVHRLPTEAEWEYACRAGTTFDLPPNIDDMGWHQGNFELELHPVGKKKPNAWGLYDMHGNANEWVADWYDKDYYRRTPAADPPGPASGYTRMYRSSDAWRPASDARCANRHRGGSLPVERGRSLGFRLVRQAR
jgi:formylglycine-generating enzyme required for sulfatase activity